MKLIHAALISSLILGSPILFADDSNSTDDSSSPTYILTSVMDSNQSQTEQAIEDTLSSGDLSSDDMLELEEEVNKYDEEVSIESDIESTIGEVAETVADNVVDVD